MTLLQQYPAGIAIERMHASYPDAGRRRFLSTLGFGTAASLLLPGFARAACDLPLFSNGFEPTAAALGSSCVLIPSETQGPYPLLSVLQNSAMVRADITEGKPGIPLTLNLLVVNLNDNCAPLENVGVYAWHCDKDGVYSGYSQPGGVNTSGQTFLRGIQFTDCQGLVSFQSIYPGWYNGRITHIHFQIYLNSLGTLTATSQLAFPQDLTTQVYSSSLYAAHGQNTSVNSFASDNVFADGVSNQMVTTSGSLATGLTADLLVAVAV